MSIATLATQITMTSLEMVDYINSQRKKGESELRHDHFMAKVIQVLGKTVAPNFRGYYTASNGKQNPMYVFPKREACLMGMSYSYALQAKIFDKMTYLEALQEPSIPKTMAQALRLAADQAEQIEAQQAKLAIAAPKAEFVDHYVDSTGLKGFRQVAKLLNIKEPTLRQFLSDNQIMYQLAGEWTAYQCHIDAGRLTVKAGASDTGHAYNTAKFTPKGVAWLAGLIASKGATAAILG